MFFPLLKCFTRTSNTENFSCAQLNHQRLFMLRNASAKTSNEPTIESDAEDELHFLLSLALFVFSE